MSFLDNHQESPTDPPRTWPSRYNAMLEALDNVTTVVQVVTAVSSSVDATTSGSFVATSLSASITPQHSDSLLIATVSGHGIARRVSGDPAARSGSARLYNVTDDGALQGAEDIRVGRALVASSEEPASSYAPLNLKGRYAVDSLSQRTIRLEIRSQASGSVEMQAGWSGQNMLMTIMEVRP